MGILIAYLLGILTTIKPKNQDGSQLHQSPEQPQGHSLPNGPISVMCVPPPLGDAEKAEKKKKKRRETIKFWLENFGAFILFGVFAFTILTWCATKKAAEAAKESADATWKQLELSERPWIKIDSVKTVGESPEIGALSYQKIGPFKDSPDVHGQVTLQISTSTRNIGHSVADVSVRAWIAIPKFTVTGYWDMVKDAEQKFCNANRSITTPQTTLFPDDPLEWGEGAGNLIRTENINYLPNDERTYIVPSLIVCVSYQLRGMPNIYQTRAVFSVVHSDSGTRFFEFGKCDIQPNLQFPMIFCKGGLPASKLKLIREPMADYAD